MSDLLQSGQHPDADQLSAFIEHTLPAHEQEETLAHLAICPHCRSIVALSLPAAEELPKIHAAPNRRPWLSGWVTILPVGAALAALILAGIYIRNGFVAETHLPPTQIVQSTPPPARKPLPPTLSSKLQKSGKAMPGSTPGPAAPAPEASSAMETFDRLMPIPSDGRGAHHRNQNQPAVLDAAKPEDQSALLRASLPSGLRALSTVTNAGEVVAIDTQHTLFFSKDGGTHWSVINQPWQGRAIKVELASNPTGSRNAAPAGMLGGVLGGITSHDSVEAPKATLSGEIADPAGASIPNASVAVTNSLTQAVHRTTTDPAGRYRVDELDPGTYRLQAEAPGFTSGEVSGLSLSPAQQSQKDLTLAVGAAAQTVEVQGQPHAAALAAPKVKQQISAVGAAVSPVLRFEITTDAGEHWVSTDGRSWQRKGE